MSNRAPGILLNLLVAFAALFYAMPASATRVAGYAAGTVNDFHIEVRGEGVNVFGLDAEGLLGQTARIDFSYDTDLAPPDTNPAENRGGFETSAADPSWLEMSITLNGITYDFAPTRRYADMGSGFHFPEYDHFQLSVLRYLPVENGNRREFIELALDLPSGSVLDGSLPTHVPATAPFGQAVNGVTFSVNDFDFDPETQQLTYERHVYFNLDIDEIEITPVPEPAAAFLVGFGLLGLGLKARQAGRSDS